MADQLTSCCFYSRNLTVTQVYAAPLPFFVNCLISIVILQKNIKKWEYERCVGSGTICSVPLYEMVIHSNGIVSACCVDWKFETKYGDVNQQSLRDIWHSKELRDFQIKLIEGGRDAVSFCSECEYHGGDNIDNVKEQIIEKLKNTC